MDYDQEQVGRTSPANAIVPVDLEDSSQTAMDLLNRQHTMPHLQQATSSDLEDPKAASTQMHFINPRYCDYSLFQEQGSLEKSCLRSCRSGGGCTDGSSSVYQQFPNQFSTSGSFAGIPEYYCNPKANLVDFMGDKTLEVENRGSGLCHPHTANIHPIGWNTCQDPNIQQDRAFANSHFSVNRHMNRSEDRGTFYNQEGQILLKTAPASFDLLNVYCSNTQPITELEPSSSNLVPMTSITAHDSNPGTVRKARKRRAVIADAQRLWLEHEFRSDQRPDFEKRQKLAERLGLRKDEVNNWFKNRRARERKKGRCCSANDYQ